MGKSVELPSAADSVTLHPVAKIIQPIALRRAVEGDKAFVAQTWLRSSRKSSPGRSMDPAVFSYEQGKVIARMWARHLEGQATITIAADPDQTEQILGWACGEPFVVDQYDEAQWSGRILHYLYVPRNFRQRYIAKRLVAALIGAQIPPVTFYTHLPEPDHVNDFRRLFGLAEFNPFLLRDL